MNRNTKRDERGMIVLSDILILICRKSIHVQVFFVPDLILECSTMILNKLLHDVKCSTIQTMLSKKLSSEWNHILLVHLYQVET